ncbi:MAG: aminotransferase class V-fold PLP-dependent enzyme, partial [Bacteroidia bacterium]
MSDRRKFMAQLGATAGVLTLSGLLQPLKAIGWPQESDFSDALKRVNGLAPEAAALDEDFWSWVRSSYTVSPNIINLNNGGVAPQPKPVQDAHIRYYQLCNEAPSYYMWRTLDAGREPLRRRLAGLAGVDKE